MLYRQPRVNLVAIILLLLGGAYHLRASSDYESQIQSALTAMYTYKFARAQALFEGLATPQKFHPLAPLGALASRWLGDQEQFGFTQANQLLLPEIDHTVQIYRDYLQRSGQSAEIYFYLGATLGLKARVALGRKDWLTVLVNGYTAVSYIRKASRLDPNFCELQLPLGVFNYYVGISKGYMRIAAFIMNTSGDKEEGLRQIHYAAQKAQYGKYEARGILAFIYLYLENKSEVAYQEAAQLSKKFPSNPYYHFLQAEALLALNNLRSAEKEIAILSSILPQLQGFTQAEYRLRLHLLEGEVAFAKRDWNKAWQELSYYVEHYNLESDIPLTIALLKLGQIADLAGNRQTAIRYYQKARDLDNRTYICRQAAQYLQTPFSTQIEN